MRLRDGVVQPARRLGDGDDEDEVEEELERRRRRGVARAASAPVIGPIIRAPAGART